MIRKWILRLLFGEDSEAELIKYAAEHSFIKEENNND